MATMLYHSDMATTLEKHIAKSITSLHNGSDDYDITFEVVQQSNVKTFQVHSVILRAVSLYFKAALSKRWSHEKLGWRGF